MHLSSITHGEWILSAAILLLLASNVILYARLYPNPFSRWLGNSAVAWNNDKLIVYHGTDSETLASQPWLARHAPFRVGKVIPFSVDLSLCRPATDFGRGFYTTTSLHQAKQWANAKQGRVASSVALVLQFEVDRNWLAGQDTLVFVRDVQHYWDFVDHCRSGFAVHNRYSHQPKSAYDVVYGLVTIWPSEILLQDCDQISFHTDRAAAGLGSQNCGNSVPVFGWKISAQTAKSAMRC